MEERLQEFQHRKNKQSKISLKHFHFSFLFLQTGIILHLLLQAIIIIMVTNLKPGWNNKEFMEKNLRGNRAALGNSLKQGIWQGGGNTAVINTETLQLFTEAQLMEAEEAMRE